MKQKLYITSTSNLLPNTTFWNDLNKKIDLYFSDYGDFKNTLINTGNEKNIFFLLFVNDLLENNTNIQEANKVLKLVISLIESRLKNSSGNLIIFYSLYEKINTIDRIKHNNFKYEFSTNIYKSFNFLKIKYKNLILLNIDEEFSEKGLNENFDDRNWYLAKCRLSINGIKKVTECLEKIYDKLYQPSKKLLILDCDNTLWGGVVGEDGWNKLQIGNEGIGKAYLDFQNQILKIKNQGTLLALSSKNREGDVWEVFKKNKSMLLKKSHFISAKINWEEKYKNIVEISEDLGISLDSFVFWDDNPIERNKIRRFLPDIEVIEPDEDISFWPGQLIKAEYFSKIKLTKEDLKKNKQYKQRSVFIDKKKQSKNEETYLKSINIKPSILKLTNNNLSRASQMTLKTNQFNLSTKRYNESDILNISKNKKNIIKLISLRDIYGDHGIIALYILKNVGDKSYLIDTFLMSCRVLGRYLENYMINLCIEEIKKIGAKELVLNYVKTKKNYFCEKFIKNLSLKSINYKKKNLSTNGKFYKIPLNQNLNIKFLNVYK